MVYGICINEINAINHSLILYSLPLFLQILVTKMCIWAHGNSQMQSEAVEDTRTYTVYIHVFPKVFCKHNTHVFK